VGKPFLSEVLELDATYSAVLAMDVSALQAAVAKSANCPLVAVGSGGSLSAAHFACQLHERFTGLLARACTPLGVLSLLADPGSRRCVVNSAALCLSAGGSNTDINRAFRELILSEPRHLTALCARRQSPLARIANLYTYVDLIDFALPSKKDGFLATNSLLAFATLLARAYCQMDGSSGSLPSSLGALMGTRHDVKTALDELRMQLGPLLDREHLVVLHGANTKPAAWDIESKFTEAALGCVQIADYRNFAHGRHHWLAKRGEASAVLALADESETALADRTVALLPPRIPHLVLRCAGDPVECALASIVKGFLVTAIAGEKRSIDPGRPGVPAFGRRLYHLGVGRVGGPAAVKTHVQRKASACRGSEETLTKAYSVFVQRLAQGSFSALVMDYDGTLCGAENRFGVLDKRMAREIIRLLRAGIPLGIATGRGKSVRQSLCKAFPASLWRRIIVGYYNAAECASLNNTLAPDGTAVTCVELTETARMFSADTCLQSMATLSVRKRQVSIVPHRVQDLEAVWEAASRYSFLSGVCGLHVVMSSHSVDVLAPGVSKRNVVDAMREVLPLPGAHTTLCIGDRGRWPGNDWELLAEPWALSVDAASADLHTCWNLAPPGYRGPQAALFYLRCLKPAGGRFRFDLRRGRREAP